MKQAPLEAEVGGGEFKAIRLHRQLKAACAFQQDPVSVNNSKQTKRKQKRTQWQRSCPECLSPWFNPHVQKSVQKASEEARKQGSREGRKKSQVYFTLCCCLFVLALAGLKFVGSAGFCLLSARIKGVSHHTWVHFVSNPGRQNSKTIAGSQQCMSS